MGGLGCEPGELALSERHAGGFNRRERAGIETQMGVWNSQREDCALTAGHFWRQGLRGRKRRHSLLARCRDGLHILGDDRAEGSSLWLADRESRFGGRGVLRGRGWRRRRA